MEDLPALARRLSYPGANKLFLAARKQGLPVTRADVEDFTRRQGAKQIFERVQPSAGKSAAESPEARYQADLIDLTGESREEGGHRYVLTLINVFTRELWARPLKSKTPADVAPVLERMLRARPALPQFLSTDRGAEFRGPTDAMLQAMGIIHHEKDPLSINSLAVLDRAIQDLKGRVARLLAAGHHTSWAEALHEAVEGYNHTYHSTVHGTPHEAAVVPTIKFMLFQDNAHKLAHNAHLAERRLDRLQALGAFRRPLGPPNKMDRGFHARFGEVEELAGVKGRQVLSTHGPPVNVKHVRPVPIDSTEAHAVLARGGALVERKREQLNDVAAALKRLVARGPVSLAAASTRLRELLPGYDEALRSAHLTLAGLARLYPESFVVDASRGEARVRRA